MTTLVVQNFDSFIFANGEELKTTSLKIAEAFGKRHAHVIRDIQKIIKNIADLEHAPKFGLMSVDVEIGNGAIKKSPAYEMDKDGFMLVVMGYTGEAAMKIKVAYINTFNLMHAKLFPKRNGLVELPPTRETLHAQLQEYFEIFRKEDTSWERYRKKLTPVQLKQINARIDELEAQQIGTSREDLIFQIHSKIWSTIGTPDARRGQPLTDSRSSYKKICEFLKIEPISDEATERHDFLSWLFTENPDFAEKIIMQEPLVQVVDDASIKMTKLQYEVLERVQRQLFFVMKNFEA